MMRSSRKGYGGYERSQFGLGKGIYRRRSFLDWLKARSATFWIILITVLISLGTFALWNLEPTSINMTALYPLAILQGKYIWTLVTHMFIHGSLAHLFINMFVLFSLGGLAERLIGRKRFVVFYLIAGIFAGLLSVILSGYFGFGAGEAIFGAANVPMVGASGAIFGLAGLFMILVPRMKFTFLLFPFFSFPAYVIIPAVLFLTWVGTATAAIVFHKAVLLGNVAHFGGFLAGVVYGFYLRSKYRKKVALLQRYFR